ncbi:putative DNA modification/repair radical SAM protein [Peptoniphilus asaccharolyticus DSM 20463]|uniref:Putative DNA modification/repair radical SAM protein n=1 Tax=Peptoniphilus asaccharolyticus DSM 20463 TaxID=573058 RepID=A0A1W1UH12_PEPAS|nr:putative DNA modification/repair radical SAM protein [Peptoniphilus asaccharolyticus]MBL7574712.1 putative DNA modification/repair radical SAM protein [Peptoniphilus asaccharolyticus]SMB80386.1 putative DNA modification/repair radical SAM protein [Peptoniphilus asaccharolyticus DSM 20463]
MELKDKLEILTDAAKYDVSCSSSGSDRKNNKGLGNGHISGICHSWSEDGRCISLLKILLTNKCIYNCEYCINRRDNDVLRAEFTPREVADLTINFYKRNYIEGLFLSSGIVGSPDKTMEKLIEIARILRQEYNFNGYIHMKGIPGASEELIRELGLLIDRISINIELPSEKSLALLAPQKNYEKIFKPMDDIKNNLLQNIEERKKFRKAPKFVPAGQTTQMIIGATGENDLAIINRAEALYGAFDMKRVYYSGYVPVVDSKYTKGIEKVPLLREHRIYQADWLLRFYGFKANEILNNDNPFFDLRIDPKANWAIENIELFPIEINRATYEELMRIPGFGRNYALRIIKARKFAALKYDDLRSLKISTKRAINFITVGGVYRGKNFSTKESLKDFMGQRDPDSVEQLKMW